MSEVVQIDKKGRLVIPKTVREKTGIPAPGRIIVRAKSEGVAEMVRVDRALPTAREIARSRLRNWREESHEATKLLRRLVK